MQGAGISYHHARRCSFPHRPRQPDRSENEPVRAAPAPWTNSAAAWAVVHKNPQPGIDNKGLRGFFRTTPPSLTPCAIAPERGESALLPPAGAPPNCSLRPAPGPSPGDCRLVVTSPGRRRGYVNRRRLKGGAVASVYAIGQLGAFLPSLIQSKEERGSAGNVRYVEGTPAAGRADI